MQPQPPTPSVQSPPAVLRTVVWCPTWEAPPGDLPPPSDTPGFTWSLALSSAVVWAPSESSAPRVLQKNPFVFPAWQWARQGWGETGVASPPPSHPHSWQDCSFEDVVGLRQNMGFRIWLLGALGMAWEMAHCGWLCVVVWGLAGVWDSYRGSVSMVEDRSTWARRCVAFPSWGGDFCGCAGCPRPPACVFPALLVPGQDPGHLRGLSLP